jgi:hypothetical protein
MRFKKEDIVYCKKKSHASEYWADFLSKNPSRVVEITSEYDSNVYLVNEKRDIYSGNWTFAEEDLELCDKKRMIVQRMKI